MSAALPAENAAWLAVRFTVASRLKRSSIAALLSFNGGFVDTTEFPGLQGRFKTGTYKGSVEGWPLMLSSRNGKGTPCWLIRPTVEWRSVP